MANQHSVGNNLNKKLKVFSNEKIIKIAHDMLYHSSTAYLKTEVKIEKDKRLYLLHYHYNLIEFNSADCGPRETRNIRFSYFDPEFPGKEFYSNGSECLFFDDPELLNDFSDVYKMLLLKKFTLLSFIYEFINNTNINEKLRIVISNQLKRIKKELLFRFNNVFTVYSYYDNNEAQDYTEYHKSDYPVKSINYKSNFIAWNDKVSDYTKVEPNSVIIKLQPIKFEEEEKDFTESESESEKEPEKEPEKFI